MTPTLSKLTAALFLIAAPLSAQSRLELGLDIAKSGDSQFTIELRGAPPGAAGFVVAGMGQLHWLVEPWIPLDVQPDLIVPFGADNRIAAPAAVFAPGSGPAFFLQAIAFDLDTDPPRVLGSSVTWRIEAGKAEALGEAGVHCDLAATEGVPAEWMLVATASARSGGETFYLDQIVAQGSSTQVYLRLDAPAAPELGVPIPKELALSVPLGTTPQRIVTVFLGRGSPDGLPVAYEQIALLVTQGSAISTFARQ